LEKAITSDRTGSGEVANGYTESRQKRCGETKLDDACTDLVVDNTIFGKFRRVLPLLNKLFFRVI